MRVGIATDHGGFTLKEEMVAQLRAAGHEVVDFGAYSLVQDDDYPDVSWSGIQPSGVPSASFK
jgi:ribose 5-phosphate isomerase B